MKNCDFGGFDELAEPGLSFMKGLCEREQVFDGIAWKINCNQMYLRRRIK